jgi:hypothetical protein
MLLLGSLRTLPACDTLRGPPGDSAYDIWLAQGHRGTEADFLEWLRGDAGADGAAGAEGTSAYQAWLDQGYVGTEAEYVAWQQAPITDHFGGPGTAEPGRGADCTMGEIQLIAGYRATGIPAHGQIINIETNSALFSLLGTSYGGDGVTTFALPDLSAVEPKSANGVPLTYTICALGLYPSSYDYD